MNTTPILKLGGFSLFGVLMVLSMVAIVLTGKEFWAFLPLMAAFAWLGVQQYQWIYGLAIMATPLSVDTFMNNNTIGMSVPAEPILVVLMFVFLYKSILNPQASMFLWKHSFTTWIILGFVWMLVCTLFSTHPLVSIKSTIMRTWSIVGFYFVTYYVVRQWRNVEKVWGLYMIPLLVVVVYTLFRHAERNFAFFWSSYVMFPFYKNHVNYGTAVAAVLPFALAGIFQKGWKKGIYLGLSILFIVAVIFSYTRASYIAIFIIPVVALAYYLRMIRVLVTVALIVGTLGIGYLLYDDNYLQYAHGDSYTEWHKNDFNKQLTATTKFKDVSSVERFYRWVAAYNMVKERPILGFGAGSFIFEYKSYTNAFFRTEVSNNPENSGLHSQFLTAMVEGGLWGLFLFLGLVVTVVNRSQRIFNKAHNGHKWYVLASGVSFIVLLLHLLINDLLEVDEVASLFYINMAVLVNLEERYSVPQETKIPA